MVGQNVHWIYPLSVLSDYLRNEGKTDLLILLQLVIVLAIPVHEFVILQSFWLHGPFIPVELDIGALGRITGLSRVPSEEDLYVCEVQLRFHGRLSERQARI